MKVRKSPVVPYRLVLEGPVAETELRLQTYALERVDYRPALLGLLPELQPHVERRNVKPH
jgi:hypothetical protein